MTTPSEVASDVECRNRSPYARDMGIRVLGIAGKYERVSVSSCGAENELFEGNTEAMCEVLDLPSSSVVFPSIVRSPRRHSTRGNRFLIPTIRPFRNIKTSLADSSVTGL